MTLPITLRGMEVFALAAGVWVGRLEASSGASSSELAVLLAGGRRVVAGMSAARLVGGGCRVVGSRRMKEPEAVPIAERDVWKKERLEAETSTTT